MGKFNKCCCCISGAVIPKWQNVTKVRPVSDTSPAHYTAAPFPRYHPISDECTGSPAPAIGTCGYWVSSGGLKSVSAQEIQDTVDDIMMCANNDATHKKYDKNCFYNDQSTTVDMRSKMFGGLWVFAKKNWHGAFPWTSKDACAPDPNNVDPNNAPDQIKYRTESITADLTVTGHDGGSVPGDIENDFKMDAHCRGSRTINQYTGILHNGIVTSQNWYYWDTGTTPPTWVQTMALSGGAGTQNEETGGNGIFANGPIGGSTVSVSYNAGRSTNIDTTVCADLHCADIAIPGPLTYIKPIFLVAGYTTISGFVNAWNTAHSGADDPYGVLPAIADPNNYLATIGNKWSNDVGTDYQTDYVFSMTVKWTRTDSKYSWFFQVDFTDTDTHTGNLIVDNHATWSGSKTLSDGYTPAAVLQDLYGAMAAWNLGDGNLQKWRTDEELALGPLCIYDEVGPATPVQGFLPATMNDYGQTQITDPYGNAPGSDNYVVTWPQTSWTDPQDFLWENPSGGFSGAPDEAGHNRFIYPLWTGQIISHTQDGSEKFFWFGYQKLQRVPCTEDEGYGSGFTWLNLSNGDYPDPLLSPCTMRWMNNQEAQWDGNLCNPAVIPVPGNFPQSWLHQMGGVLKGGKYVQPYWKWPSVNYGRPCGPDKYAVDQTTIGCVTTAAENSFTVKKPSTTTGDFPSTGYIIVTGEFGIPGVYPVTGAATDNGDGTFTIPVGNWIDEVPSDWTHTTDGDYLGWLRWPSYPGICGRAAITTAYAEGTVTITSSASLPYLRVDPATGTIVVDIYDSNMGLIAGGATITRVSDTTFTFTHDAMPTAAYMTGHGVDWTKYDSSPKQTGVYIDWQFNQRAAQAGFTSPPTWYADIPGCIGSTRQQFQMSGQCPIAGVVPGYSPVVVPGSVPNPSGTPPASVPVETFTSPFLFPMTESFAFDDFYGAHWQAQVALTMPDPFWQKPFKPDCDGSTFVWTDDNGCGEPDDEDGTPVIKYYAHAPWVEAAMNIPVGDTLPGGVTLQYAPSNQIAPPFYPNGLNCDPGGDGSYLSFETDWGFVLRACGISCTNSHRFDYSYVTCPSST